MMLETWFNRGKKSRLNHVLYLLVLNKFNVYSMGGL